MGTSKIIRILSRAALGVLLLTSFIFGIKQLREPDIFWQLRTGEWIVQHKAVMDKDIFSYTFHNAHWINVKWGFEVLQYFMYKMGGVEFTPALQCIASILMLLLFWQLYKLIYARLSGEKLGYPHAAFLIIAILFLLACAYRMNGRPEMTSHVLTGLYLLILLRYTWRPGNFIFLLIPLEIFWVNMHEAYGTGEVIMAATLFGLWVEYFILKQKKIRVPFKLTCVVILSIAATVIHPYGLKMILHPYEIFSQVSENKFTTELLSIANREYWQKEAYLNLFFLVTALVGLFLPYKYPSNKKPAIKWLQRPFYTFGVGYVLLLSLFFYLSLTAYRNIIFFIIISAPATANCLASFFDLLKSKIPLLSKQSFQISLYSMILGLALLFYI